MSREIEEFLHHHPKIEDVYVVGVPDTKYGEQLLASVKLHYGEDVPVEEFKEYCRGKIARHKIPHYWEFVSEFPMTANGKIQKYKIAQGFTRKLGL